MRINESINFLFLTKLLNCLNFLEFNPINSAGSMPTSDKTAYLPPIKLLCFITSSFKLCARLNEELKNGHIDCILVDEAQFLSRQQVKELASIVDQKNIPVLAYGLRTDFMGESFEGSQYLLAWADEIREIKAICHCGKKATMNARIGESGEIERAGEQIEIGGNERYVSLCRKCFSEGISGE